MDPDSVRRSLFWIAAAVLTTTAAHNQTANSSDVLLDRRTIKDGVVQIPKEIQQALIDEARERCKDLLLSTPLPPENASLCFRTWDTVACWPDAQPGEVLTQPCPNYIHNFVVTVFPETASRTCREDGTWFPNPNTGKSGWTDYSRCVKSMSTLMKEHVPRITLMYNIGYGVSLLTLVVAVFIMLYFKRLYCPRNTLHLHLFFSFMLRAGLSLLRDNLFVYGLGLQQDVKLNMHGHPVFLDSNSLEMSHWQCKTLTFFFIYFLSANYIWIFNEGLYLHMLIFVSVFSEKTTVLWYIIFGWLSPLLFTVPWAIVRATLHNVYCWNISFQPGFEWIIKGPLLVFILVNFGFFVSIVRVLFTKLKASQTKEGRKYRYKKLAKSTLVLIPLFGVHYILFSLVPVEMLSESLEIAKLYFEMICNSFQGFLVALLYCFLNGEVQTEIKKKWQRLRLQYAPKSSGVNRLSKSVTDRMDLLNGQCRQSGRCLMSSVTDRSDVVNYDSANVAMVQRRGFDDAESDGRRADRATAEAGCGQILLEANDDYLMSESGMTETSCFSETTIPDGYRALRHPADAYPDGGIRTFQTKS